ncbi:MAG: nucleotide exchange factor GrpE, partial [Nitrosopumilus sp.]|nr:nucleotide exchange factor GrpE [Nitrosopumilus sp.]
MSNESNSDEIPVNVVSKNEEENNPSTIESKSLESPIDELTTQLELEKQRSSEYEEKLKLVLADFQNLSRKTQT